MASDAAVERHLICTRHIAVRKLSISIAHPLIGSSVSEIVVSSERGIGF